MATSLKKFAESIRNIMVKHDMGDHSIFVDCRYVQYHHTYHKGFNVEFKVSIWLDKGNPYSNNIKLFDSQDPNVIKRNLKLFLKTYKQNQKVNIPSEVLA